MKGPFSLNAGVGAEIAQRFGFALDEAKVLGGFHNLVLEVPGALRSAIIRISQVSHRSKSDVEAEVEWVNFMCERGAPLCWPITSNEGHFVESVGPYTVMKMQKAEGEVVAQKDLADYARVLGKTMGKMHALSKTFAPQKTPRHAWNEDHLVASFSERAESPKESEAFFELCETILTLPKGRDRYGLVHNDLHSGNFLAHGPKAISIFDTDDACYQWYMGDIAMVLFYALLLRDDAPSAARSFFPTFWAGYCEENTLEVAELEWLPLFFRRRAFVVCGVLYLQRESFSPARQRFYERLQHFKNIDACRRIDFRTLLKR